MNTQSDITTPVRQIPLAVPIGVCSILLLSVVALAVYDQTYNIAIEELRKHEVIDLADETRKNADGLKATLTQMREDVLTLAQHPTVRQLVESDDLTNQELRAKSGEIFIKLCKAHPDKNFPVSGQEKSPAEIPRWKHYMKVRFIDPDGHERVCVDRQSRNANETQYWLKPADESVEKEEEGHLTYGDKQYFEDTKSHFDRMKSNHEPLRVCMSRIEFNQEERPESTMGATKTPPHMRSLTIRAAVPVTRMVGGQLEFRGILIIDMDLEAAIKSLTDASRHLVYIGTGEANETKKGRPVLLYNPEFPGVKAPADASQNPTHEFEDFEKILRRDISNYEQLTGELGRFFSTQPEIAELGNNDDAVLPLADRGERFPKNTLKGERLKLTNEHPFFLTKLDLEHPADAKAATMFRKDLSKKLKESRSNSIHVNSVVREDATVISIRGSDEQELTKLVDKLEELGRQDSGDLIKRIFRRPVRCENFAAHFYRIYFDPSRPQRYIAMLVGFSDEELTADLAATRSAAFNTFLIVTVIGSSIFLLSLWWFVTRPIQQLTVASESIARGEFDTTLPIGKRDEIGKLSRTFAVMVNEVWARDGEIRRQNEELDEKVRSRTASLAEARDQLEVAVKSRDAFLATVSHELRTPLNHIYGYAQLLEISDLDEEQRSDLEKLQGSSRHLLRLVQDILDYQKIIMGRLPINPVHCDIAELLASIRESNAPKAAERSNQLVMNLNGLQGRMYNDENRFRQILDNLLSNACKFTTNGTITIDAEAKGAFIEVAVIDTGIGISDAAMDKLFKPFSKVSDSSLNPDGTGLGLVISRELARRMGGDITVTSRPKEGCTFVTRILRELPTEPGDERFDGASATETTILETQPTRTATEVSNRRSSNQVLVIDDDPNVRELMTRFLTDEGLDVITASGGAEGIEMAARHAPSVITLDLVMPDVDGWSVLAALKANALTATIPVVLVTVLDDPQKGYSFGATDYVAKPIEGDRLVRVVRRYCGAEAPTVLIIDDNVKDREIVRRVLKNDGCVVVEAADGAEGLAKSAATEFDLIVLDLMMPVMDGFTFVDEIRKRKGGEMPPIVVLTALQMTASNRDRLNGIVSEVIQKGEFDRRRFLQEIHRHLHQDSGKS